MPQLRKGNRLFPLPALTLRSCLSMLAIAALAAVLTAQCDIQRDAHNADETTELCDNAYSSGLLVYGFQQQ